MQGRAGLERAEEAEREQKGQLAKEEHAGVRNIAVLKGRAGRVRASGEGRALRGIGRGGGGVPRVHAVSEGRGMAVAGSAGVGEKEGGGSGMGRAKEDG